MAVGLSPPLTLAPIPGLRLGAVPAGLRYQNRNDLVLFEMSPATHTAAVFTRNRFAAAPVVVAREHMRQARPRALLVNAGQANAGTGEAGLEAARNSCAAVAGLLGCTATQVLPFSTGVIGDPPPMDILHKALPDCIGNRKENGWMAAAQGIMTTDTMAKGASETVVIGDRPVTITGIAKGSGMIRPDMATMLAFVATDANVESTLLQESLQDVVNRTFNRITVDGDTSTNDACLLMATGESEIPLIDDRNSVAYRDWFDTLFRVYLHLAQAIVRDGEGATKFVSVIVDHGASEADCLAVAYTVAHSPLTKTALYASDPNWGRILAAVGRAPVDKLDMNRVSLTINDVCVLDSGAPSSDYTEERGQQAMASEEIDLRIDLGRGESTATVWTTDLSHEYIRINAEYRS